MINKVLVITEQEEDKTFAMEKASHLAELFKAEVFVVQIMATSDSRNNTEALSLAKQKLEAKATKLFHNQLHIIVLATDHIAADVKQLCQKESIDLVVKTGHRTESIFHTPLDWQLIRELDSPLLILTEQKWRNSASILATVDLKDASNETQVALNKEAVEWSSLLSDKLTMRLEACYIVAVNQIAKDMDLPVNTDIPPEEIADMNNRFKGLSDSVHHMDNDLFITAGVVHKEIPSYANAIKADVVVMGSISRKGMKGFFLGNTAEQVLKNLRTDILILRPKAKA